MPQWQITETHWPVGDKLLIPAGEVIDGVVNKQGQLVGLKWRGQELPTMSLPINVAPCDQAAADAMWLWHSSSPHRLRPISPLPEPAPLPAVSVVTPPPAPSPPTPPSWQLLTDWHASALHHIPQGDIVQGVTDKYGKLTGFRWRGETLPVASTALPREAMALDQLAADELSRQHPDALFLLRAVSPAVIRPQ
jgi:hypothetical protein